MPPALTRRKPIPFPERLLISVAEFAEWGGICDRTARKLVKEGAIRSHRVGRRVLIRPSDAQAWLDQSANSKSTQAAEESADRPELPLRTQSPGVEPPNGKTRSSSTEPADHEIEAVNPSETPSQCLRSRAKVAATNSR